MQTDPIAEIGVDSERRLCVRPTSVEFPLIYRAAMEVRWESQGRYLYSPAPRERSYVEWFQQIVAAAKEEYGCTLAVTEQTEWRGVEPALQSAIIAASARACV